MFTTRNQKQYAVYWGNPVNHGSGNYTYDDPVEIKCRWTNSNKLIYGTTGLAYTCVAEIFVSQDLDYGGMLWLGRLADIPSGDLDDPTAVGALMIRRFDKTPTVKATHFVRKAFV